MTGSRERFGNDKPLWKQIRGHLLQFPDHKTTKKKNSHKNLGKTKEKEWAKNQAITEYKSLTVISAVIVSLIPIFSYRDIKIKAQFYSDFN